jgi:arylsulfatase
MGPLAGLLLAAFAAAAAAAPPPPNIVFVMADQMRFDTLGDAFTPNLAALARRGLRMSSTYTSTPSCTPARSALLTGLSPWYNGMIGYGNIAPRYAFEMPREMSSLGYTTMSIGKNHYYNPADMANNTSPPPSHGWGQQLLYDGLGSGAEEGDPGGEYDTYDRWFNATTGGLDPLATGKPLMDWNSWRGASYVYNESLHPTAWVGAQALAFIANASAAPQQPFFLKVSFHRPHSPYDPPERLLNATPASELPPVYVGASWDAQFAEGPSCGPADADAWCGRMPEPAFTLSRRAYRANIKFVDEQVGLIVNALEASGLASNTWIVFLSDHGDGQGDHNLWRKCYPWELSAHVPGFITWPSSVQAAMPRGSVSPLLGELRDVFPTVLDIAGQGALTRALNGSSWACLVLLDPTGARCGAGSGGASGGAAAVPWRETLDLEHSLIFGPRIHWNAILGGPSAGRLSGLKYVFFAMDATEQLFNISSDPYEMEDLAPSPAYAGELADLRARLVSQFESEGRGAAWVSNGVLQARTTGQVYSPHYPAA